MEFKYIANDRKTGKQITDVATANSVADLITRLKMEGLLPLKIFETKASARRLQKLNVFKRRRIASKELAIFTRQMAATLGAGLLLTEALEAIADDLENEFFQKIILNIKEDIQSGENFSSALSKYPKIFPVTYVSIVKSGEATGKLHSTMSGLAKFLEDTERMKDKVKSAIRYPSFVLSFAILTVVVIVLFLIPKFQGMFDQFGASLPLMTRIVFGISEMAIHLAPVILVGLVISGIAFWYSLRFYRVRYCVDAIKLKLPLVGKDIIHKALVSRFCRTFGFLLSGGVGLSTSLDIASKAVNHVQMSKAIERIKERVISGASISDEIKMQKIFPRLVAKMTSVGERTGQMSDMFEKTADYYDEELENTLHSLTSILEPALIIFIGGIVLIVVLALYLPIFQLSAVMR